MNVTVIDTLGDWADAVAALPAPGPLPARTVLVPSERHAHALRRELARTGRDAALAGTRFLGPLTAAIEVLQAAGVPFTPGEGALRPARLLALFHEDLPLEHFDLDLLRTTRGWDEAFAGAIGDLEAAGLAPRDLPAEPAAARDLARLWSRVEDGAGTSFSSARIFREAAALLARDAGAWPFHGPTLALASGHADAVEARFLRAIPGVRLAVQTDRPAGERHLERVERLFGAEARSALAARGSTGSPRAEEDRDRAVRTPARGSTGSPRAGGPGSSPAGRVTERDLLATYLLADAAVLADPARPRSGGPDGTVDLEEHAGVEAELEATALWVARQVLEARRPLEEIAVLVPDQDPLAGLVADRLARLPFDGGPLPVFVAGGLPAISTAAGARILAVVRALRSHLSAETLAPVLPALRLEGVVDGDRTHLTHGEAMELAFGLGIVGGNPAHPAGALAWSGRAAARAGELEAALAQVHADDDSAERERWRLERTLGSLRAIRPALDALVGVARAVVEGAPLAAIGDVLGGFLTRCLLAPGEGAALPARLVEALAPACAGSLGKALSGDDALQVVEDQLLGLRVAQGRFGEPAVYVGTVAGAAGVSFGAVRIVGLCEGVLPSQPREDPVVPGALREQLERGAPDRVLRRAEDRVAAQAHALVAAVRGARDAVALSAPRVDLARTEREPGAIFIDAAAALARPHAATGAPAEAVPDGAALRRDAFRPAASAAARFRDAHPISDASWLDRVARTAPALPPEWTGTPVVDLARLAALRAPSGPLGPSDGIFDRGGPFPPVPGIAPERPISASALGQLLQCPRLFLMRRILGWDEPASAPSLRELDPLSFGSLLHRVVELFYREHGAAFSRREGRLARWLELARGVADRAFDGLLSEYPLVGEGVRLKERERLHDALREFLAYDWKGGPRRFVGVELPFGTPEAPLSVEADGETLHVHGYIDRVDAEDGVTLVRDLKSGKAHPRAGSEAGPTALRDVQLGLYQLAARKLARRWGTPAKVHGAYAYASGRGEVEERAFRADAGALEQATAEWLATAAHLLAARWFPPSADEGDCTYCPFHVVCGSGAARRAREALADVEDGPLARFRALKLDEGDEE
ncbi:PD-(D/E)XK nuclease family protein [Anaeromyxobacter dehalogenans]|uniref:PD-(D/E)XK nuclease family protein n=1 Tax=Anaeromyxobacter dehalogenans TaxID=161493 RepID=UPI0002EBF3D6|nr:PD-(D/E)XK nuclease family protein [Anaeromyxobacter dehalogenans]